MKETLWVLVGLMGISSFALGSVSGNEVEYVGGTIPAIPDGATGSFDTTQELTLVFRSAKGNFEIPYKSIAWAEYGQHLARRLGVIPGIAVPLLRKRQKKHFLTIAFANAEGKSEAAVFEIPKGMVKAFTTIIEVRTGRKVQREVEAARSYVQRR